MDSRTNSALCPTATASKHSPKQTLSNEKALKQLIPRLAPTTAIYSFTVLGSDWSLVQLLKSSAIQCWHLANNNKLLLLHICNNEKRRKFCGFRFGIRSPQNWIYLFLTIVPKPPKNFIKLLSQLLSNAAHRQTDRQTHRPRSRDKYITFFAKVNIQWLSEWAWRV